MRQIAKYFKTPGQFGIIDGPPGSGKTNLACLVIESLREDFGIGVMTNIRFDENAISKLNQNERKIYEGIYYAPKFTDFLRAYLEIDSTTVTIIDDAEQAMGSSINIMSKKGQQNNQFAKLIRKYETSLFYISHVTRYIPRYIYANPHVYIEKLKIYNKRNNGWNLKKMIWNGKTYNGIPKTKLKMETYHPPNWKYDLDMSDFYDRVSEVSQSEMKRIIREILDQKEKEINLNPKDIMRWMIEHGYPNESHYKIFPSWHRWKREFERS